MLAKVSTAVASLGLGLGYLFLTAAPSQAQTAQVHELGVLESADAALDNGSHFDSYEIAGSAGERVSISLNSTEFDTVLGLLDSEGNVLQTNDDASEGNLNSYFSFTLPADGTYTVVVTSYGPSVGGGYRLSMRNFNAPNAPRSATRVSGSSGFSPVFNALLIGLAGAALNDFFFGGGGGGTASGYPNPSDDPAMRAASRTRGAAPLPPVPKAPIVGGSTGRALWGP